MQELRSCFEIFHSYLKKEVVPTVLGLCPSTCCKQMKGSFNGATTTCFSTKSFCLNACIDLMDIKRTEFQKIGRSIASSRNVERTVHVNIGQHREFCSAAGENVRNFITKKQRHAHPLPMYLSSADGTMLSEEESVLMFPTSFSLCGI